MSHTTSFPSQSSLAVAEHSNPVRGRINAVFFDLMDGYMHWKYGELKRQLFSELPPVIVELGAGAGANFRYLPSGARVIAVEPNPYMHPRLVRSARRWGIDLEIRGLSAEGLDLPDDCVDAVLCSLVLCTVEDPDLALREVRRILRPGGRFICIEHVAAPSTSAVGRLQRWVFRPWRWFFEGCHTHRDTASALRRAGFSTTDIRPFTWRSAFVPVRPQIAAVCTE
jgi:ubiquinone/menaquinone biosynthesis C-methylase UbiE